MNDTPERVPEQPAEQVHYARLLSWGNRLGLTVLLLSFAAYALGLVGARIPLEELPALWGLPVNSYLRQTGMPVGWGWLALLPQGDILGLTGIVILAGCALPCLLDTARTCLRTGDRLFALLCMAEVAIVALAASGWLVGPH